MCSMYPLVIKHAMNGGLNRAVDGYFACCGLTVEMNAAQATEETLYHTYRVIGDLQAWDLHPRASSGAPSLSNQRATPETPQAECVGIFWNLLDIFGWFSSERALFWP